MGRTPTTSDDRLARGRAKHGCGGGLALRSLDLDLDPARARLPPSRGRAAAAARREREERRLSWLSAKSPMLLGKNNNGGSVSQQLLLHARADRPAWYIGH